MLSCDPVARDDFQHRTLIEAVHQRRPADRNLILFYLEGLSGREIAAIPGFAEPCANDWDELVAKGDE